MCLSVAGISASTKHFYLHPTSKLICPKVAPALCLTWCMVTDAAHRAQFKIQIFRYMEIWIRLAVATCVLN